MGRDYVQKAQTKEQVLNDDLNDGFFFYLCLFLAEIACNANHDLVCVDRKKFEKLFYNFWLLVIHDIVIFLVKSTKHHNTQSSNDLNIII